LLRLHIFRGWSVLGQKNHGFGLVRYSASCKLWVQLFADAGNGWPHSALQYH